MLKVLMKSDLDSISRVLTLRYDPLEKPVRKPLISSDFTPYSSYGEDVEASILDLIKKELLNKYDELKLKNVSLALSAGVDSRLTLAMIRTVLPDVKIDCISVGFGDKEDEVSQAKEISRVYDCNFHNIILDEVLSDLPKLIAIVKKPKWNLYQFYPLEHGKKYSNVFYTGDGGDELFGGYTFRYHKFLSLLPRDKGWKTKVKLYLSCHERDWVPDQNKMFGSAVKFSWEKIYELFRPYFSNDLEPLNQIFFADFNGKLLYDWLPANFAFADFLKIRIESIFLTSTMIDFATHIPPDKKYDLRTRIGKLPLRSILIKHKGNEKMMEPVKKGFSIDLISLWNRHAKEIVSAYVNAESEVVRNKIIDKDWITISTRKLEEKNSDLRHRYINKMLSILALEIWYRLFISKSLNSRQKL
ncbi:asparagine synthase-related protein [Candidatus Nitrososphaera gargensis]|nr:asparagine synthase C-terminal domain-containing protein [Candidatus Nitrososphaera gargensis]